jgi:hypothetical protein
MSLCIKGAAVCLALFIGGELLGASEVSASWYPTVRLITSYMSRFCLGVTIAFLVMAAVLWFETRS